jgi:CubicO group peptidase (beta-lactamase class C family)
MANESKSRFNIKIIILFILFASTIISAYFLATSDKYATYARYGFSFQHPKGMMIQEEGMGGIGIATITSGIVQGTLVKNGIPEIIGIIWLPFESPEPLDVILDMAFSQLGDNNVVEKRGRLVLTLKDDYEMLRQGFVMSERGTSISGVAGTWYNPLAERIYLTFYLTLPETAPQEEILRRFNRLVSSIENSYEALPDTSLTSYWPTEGWRTATPEEVGIDSEMLNQIPRIIQEEERGVDSLLVVKDGYLVMDKYFEPFKKGERHRIYSCTKSVVSTLIGIAIEEGYIEGINQTLLEFFPDRTPKNLNDWKKSITLENLLTMSAGFDAQDSWLYNWIGLNRMHESPDALQYVLDLEVIEEPGTRFEYTNGVSHLLSCIISEVTGMSSLEYAHDRLFTPLGFDEVEWKTDSLGRNWGYSTLYLTPHDMAKFGYLFLNNGTWDGEQIVSERWVREATRKHLDAPLWPGYGYQWWVDSWGHYLALGYRGQLIFVVPIDNLVVVFTGSDPDNPGFTDYLMKNWILPAISTDPPTLP